MLELKFIVSQTIALKPDFHSWSSEWADKEILHFDWLNYICLPSGENKFKILKLFSPLSGQNYVLSNQSWEFSCIIKRSLARFNGNQFLISRKKCSAFLKHFENQFDGVYKTSDLAFWPLEGTLEHYYPNMKDRPSSKLTVMFSWKTR